MKMLQDYEGKAFDEKNIKALACPIINTKSICDYLLVVPENRTRIVGRYALISFYEYAAYALHYYEFSWRSEEDKKAMKYLKKRIYCFGLRRKIRDPRIFAFCKAKNLKKLDRIYRFFVYDFIDNGAVYYGYKLIKKIQRKMIHE